jgi:hypothetical protein
MKKIGNFWCALVLLICISSNQAMSKRPKDKVDTADNKSVSIASNEKSSQETPATYLDSLNRGKEFSLKDKDFAPITVESTSVASSKDLRDGLVDGYRIQCFASSQIERIRVEQKTLELKIKYPIYIVFTSPYYKMLVGDFVKRADADNAAEKLKEIGYADAWVARSRVEVKH